MIIKSINGPNLMSNGSVMAEENRNHCKRARTCNKIATRSDQDALSHDASSRSRDARLFFEVSKLINVTFDCKLFWLVLVLVLSSLWFSVSSPLSYNSIPNMVVWDAGSSILICAETRFFTIKYIVNRVCKWNMTCKAMITSQAVKHRFIVST